MQTLSLMLPTVPPAPLDARFPTERVLRALGGLLLAAWLAWASQVGAGQPLPAPQPVGAPPVAGAVLGVAAGPDRTDAAIRPAPAPAPGASR